MEECATLIRWLDPRPGERILDVGCGHGYNDRAITRSGARVVGIDVNEERLAVARESNGGPGIEFLSMDAEEMGFPDESFDKAVSFCVIEHFRRDQKVLEHVHRVLRPGGALVLSADSLSNPEIRQEEREAHGRRYAVNTFYTRENLTRKLRDAGLEPERWRYILTTPFTLGLARVSWRLDDLPPPLLPVKVAGYLALFTAGKVASDLVEGVARRPDSGLTLLVRARKPAG